jgi:NAD(P)-dependent dehydrogenase (short-subunit alcohol dehydrogenase family)
MNSVGTWLGDIARQRVLRTGGPGARSTAAPLPARVSFGFPVKYNASKAAVRSFARTWIVDFKGRNIRVNVLSPGYTDTPGMSHFMTDEEKAAAVATVPLGRMGTPDDLGKAAVFLASDDSAYITGIELFVDGGAAQI